MSPLGLRSLVLGPPGLALGLAAALGGAGAAAGLMAYRSAVAEVEYTLTSWASIGPIWGLLGLLWTLTRRWPVAAAIATGWLALFAAVYFSDVFGPIPAGVLFGLATAVVFLPGDGVDADLVAESPGWRHAETPRAMERAEISQRSTILNRGEES